MSYLSETLANLKSGLAFKIFWMNLKANPWQWFLNELSPSSWLNPDHKLHWANLKPEMIGWGKHIAIAAAATVLLRFFTGMTNSQLIWTTVGITFVVEVIQFFMHRASFINPINSILDILFYVAGTVLILSVF